MFFKFIIISLALASIPELSARKINSISDPSSLFGLSRKTVKDDRCEETGFSCLDCEHSLYCFQFPNGDWISEEIPCNPDESCLASTGHCSTEPNQECESEYLNYKFTCHQVGLFPHVFDCTKYHLCSTDDDGKVIPDSKDYSCDKGFAFDPSTLLCSKKHEESCEAIVYSCDRVGQSGPMPGNIHFFYICLTTVVEDEPILLPHVFFCTNGEQYINGECRDPTPPSGLGADGKCDADGDFYDADDCKRFNTCVSGNNPISKACESNNYYDAWEDECKPFECP